MTEPEKKTTTMTTSRTYQISTAWVQTLFSLTSIGKHYSVATLWVLSCKTISYTVKLYVLHTSLKLNLPHRLCLWTFLKLSNVLPIPESPKTIVNMNYITFDEPISLFANDFMLWILFLSYLKQLSLVVRGKTHTTKSVRACQLSNCTDYQFVYAEILVRTLRRWFWASKDIY